VQIKNKPHILPAISYEPMWPYDPQSQAFCCNVWEFYPSFEFATVGTGSVSFSAQGNDWYFGAFDKQDPAGDFDYGIIFAGWGDTLVQIYKGGSFATAVAGENVSVDATQYNNYVVSLDKHNKLITVLVNGQVAISWFDTEWAAKDAKYYAFSQYGSNVLIQSQPTFGAPLPYAPKYPYDPQNQAFCCNVWEFWNAYTFNPSQNTQISFEAQGNDWYLGLFDQQDPNGNFDYGIIFAGWGNSMVHLYKGGSFATAVASENVTVANTNAWTKYVVTFDQTSSTISISMNKQVVISWVDSSWAAGNAQFFAFSQYGSNVLIKSAPKVK